MTLTFNIPEWGTVDIPDAENEAEEKALQAVIQATGDVHHLPDESPARAALKDLHYALEAQKKGTTPNIARCRRASERGALEGGRVDC
jgi:hypothetical protein